MDPVLDGDPVFNDPGVLHFDEDTSLEFDPADHFYDMDDLITEIVQGGENLTFQEGYVKTTLGNWSGSSNATFRAVDTFGNHTEGTFQFVVRPVNDPPVITPPIPSVRMEEDTVHVLELSRHMFDVDSSALEWTVVSGENITTVLNTTTWNLTLEPVQNWFGNETLLLTLSDGLEEVNTTVDIGVLPVNDPPVFNVPDDWNKTVVKGEEFTLDMEPLIHDVDDQDLYLQLVTVSQNIALSGNVLIIDFPLDSQATITTVTLTVSDGRGGSATADLLVHVKDPSAGDDDEEEWDLYSADVTIDDDGNWKVTAEGGPGLDIHFIVKKNDEVIAAKKMDEVEPGKYSLELGSDLFEEGETYDYYFTDPTAGDDPETRFSGEVQQPGEKGVSMLMLLAVAVLLFLLVAAVVLFLLTRKRDMDIEE